MAVRKTLSSVADVIDKIATEKRRAAEARFKPRDLNVSAPADVYRDACAAIASRFVDFRYAKSGPRFSKKVDPFTFEVTFQSSHNNVAGQFIALRLGAVIQSTKLKKWREQQAKPMFVSPYVAGAMLGNLAEPPKYFQWDLAAMNEREAIIDDAVQAIRDLALPYFARFERIESISEEMIQRDIPGTWIRDVLEFLLCFRDRPRAEAAATNFLQRHAGLIPEYRAVLNRFETQGLPNHGPAGYSQMIAWAVVAYGLTVDVGAA